MALPMTPSTTSLNRRGCGDGTSRARAPIVRQVISTRTPFLFSGMKRAGRPILLSRVPDLARREWRIEFRQSSVYIRRETVHDSAARAVAKCPDSQGWCQPPSNLQLYSRLLPDLCNRGIIGWWDGHFNVEGERIFTVDHYCVRSPCRCQEMHLKYKKCCLPKELGR